MKNGVHLKNGLKNGHHPPALQVAAVVHPSPVDAAFFSLTREQARALYEEMKHSTIVSHAVREILKELGRKLG